MDSAEYTFVFADLAGYTALTEAHGDDGGANVARRFHELTRAALGDSTLVKTLGDGVMIVASSLSAAVRLAEDLGKQVAVEQEFPAVRIALHQGTAVVHQGDYFGNSVNLTARVMEAARPGQVLCTECIADAVMSAELARAVPVGTVRLKHIAQPVALYEIAFERAADTLKHLDPVCRMMVDANTTRATLEHEGTQLHFCSQGCAAKFSLSPETYFAMPAGAALAPPGLSTTQEQRTALK
jgi:class 3 adenylate cyclase/YHS domain-containing protein